MRGVVVPLPQPPEFVDQTQTNSILFAIMTGMKPEQSDEVRKYVDVTPVLVLSGCSSRIQSDFSRRRWWWSS